MSASRFRNGCGPLSLVAIAPLLATSVLAQALPNGAEFQVNSYTTDDQRHPDVAVGTAGQFVVVWQSYGSNVADSDWPSIEAQRYSATGQPLGTQFQVNSLPGGGYYSGADADPAVAIDSAGRFVVAWERHSQDPSNDYSSIQARRFSANGAPFGEQFQVNSYTSGYQLSPDVAADSAGGFVIVWTSDGSSGNDAAGTSIQAQRFDESGAPLGTEFQVNSYTTGWQQAPAIAIDNQGRIVIAWESDGSSGTDADTLSIQAQSYDANGSTLGSQLQVNTFTTSWQAAPSVAANDQGEFTIVWTSNGSSGSDNSLQSIQGRSFYMSGSPPGPQFQVNTYTTGHQGYPVVAAGPEGTLVVGWHSQGSPGSDTSYFSIQARRFEASGAPLGSDFQVNSYTSDYQMYPVVGVDASGNFVVAWESSGSSGTDQDGASVHAQRYDALFRDGFESGSTNRWSGVTL